jgi:hypothetical protein
MANLDRFSGIAPRSSLGLPPRQSIMNFGRFGVAADRMISGARREGRLRDGCAKRRGADPMGGVRWHLLDLPVPPI